MKISKKKIGWLAAIMFVVGLVALVMVRPQPGEIGKGIYAEGFREPTRGWRIIADDYPANTWIDLLSFEWDYFMIHSYDHRFAGTIGYVVTNPRNRLPWLKVLPSGGNVAFIGEKDGQGAIANFEAFGLDPANFRISKTERIFDARNPANGRFGILKPTPDGKGMLLQGRSQDFAWNLEVRQAQLDRDAGRLNPGKDEPFTLAVGRDVGVVRSEEWNVDNIWPKTEFKGTVTLLKTGEVIPVIGKGYREDSFGRWAMIGWDGWDFLVFSEDHADGVSFVMQTYHKSDSMDFIDVSFKDAGKNVTARFRPTRGELGYVHEDWSWDARTLGCVPDSTTLRAANKDYVVEAEVAMKGRQAPLLHKPIIGTRIYFIQEQFPSVKGVIRRAKTGEVVTTFEGQAGGEFSYLRHLRQKTDAQCRDWGRERFSAPMPASSGH